MLFKLLSYPLSTYFWCRENRGRLATRVWPCSFESEHWGPPDGSWKVCLRWQQAWASPRQKRQSHWPKCPQAGPPLGESSPSPLQWHWTRQGLCFEWLFSGPWTNTQISLWLKPLWELPKRCLGPWEALNCMCDQLQSKTHSEERLHQTSTQEYETKRHGWMLSFFLFFFFYVRNKHLLLG